MMTKEDFYDLRVGQEIWWSGQEVEVRGKKQEKGVPNMVLVGSRFLRNYWEKWENMYADCSLTPLEPELPKVGYPYANKELPKLLTLVSYVYPLEKDTVVLMNGNTRTIKEFWALYRKPTAEELKKWGEG